MPKNTNYFFLFLIVISTILPKWIISGLYFENSVLVDTIINIKDIQYFPIVKSLSEFTLNPSYLEDITDNKFLSFPIYSILFHSIFFKIFGIYSFIVLEFIFQIVFLFIFFKTIKKIFENSNYSFFFCIFIFLTISLLQLILFYEDMNFITNLFNTLDENFGSRFPRPLFTGIIYFYFFYILYFFKDKIEKLNFKYFFLLFLLLSIFLNSFFYYFINFSVLTIFIFFKYLNKNILKNLFENKLKLLFLMFSFIIFCLPFLIQFFLGEEEYSKRIGVIQINKLQKLYLLKYYLLNLFRFEFLILFTLCLALHFYLKRSLNKYKNQISKINIYFYFILVSIITPIIFFIISPKLISIYHFLGILIFILIFYIILSSYFIFSCKFNIKKGTQYLNFLKYFFIFIIFFLNIYIEKNLKFKNIEQINEIQNIQKFFVNNNLLKSDKKLFTNDLKIMNLWLFNGNNQLIVSDGFTNSLKDGQIEFNFLNNLKNFGITNKKFKEIISYDKPEIRNDFLMRLFSYKYQANSLYTLSNLDEYHVELKNKIKNTSPFRVQMQVVSEVEKDRFLKNFINLKVSDKSLSEVVIIGKKETLRDFEIKNERYKLMLSSKNYDIYIFEN